MSKREDDLNREIQADLALEAAQLREEGLSPEEARLAAERAFGSTMLVKENVRETWAWAPLDRVWQDIRYGWRGMTRNPAFTAVAVLSLALGIGANTAIFSLIDALMLRWLPVSNPQSLFQIKT